MKTKSTGIIFISVLFLLATGIGTAFYLYNKEPKDIRSSKGLSVQAIDLYRMYNSHAIAANNKYSDKILEVSGILTEISLNLQQQQVILLKTGTSGASINCTMESPVENIQLLEKVIIKGVCSGIGEADADLGIPADVYLTRCYSKNGHSNY